MTSEQLTAFFATAGHLLKEHEEDLDRSLARFFPSLRQELHTFREQKRDSDIYLASDFNVFDFIDPDENTLSDILKVLLDPRGPHGQGVLFLEQFLAHASVPTELHLAGARIFREDATSYIYNPWRRIDITLDLSLDSGGHQHDFGIGIENKPWAGDQHQQVPDYIEHFRKRYGDYFLLIYLSGSDLPPSSLPEDKRTQLERLNQFRFLTYRTELRTWLMTTCKLCKADKVRGFLEDFISYIEASFRFRPPEET